MSIFNSDSIPRIDENTVNDYMLLNVPQEDSYITDKLCIKNIPITTASDANFGGVKVGFPESTEDDGLYALRVEDGNGYFTVQWTDKVILSAQYNPSLSAIQIEIVDGKGTTKIINVNVAGLIDNYYGDESTLIQRNNTFSVKQGVYLPNGNYVSTKNITSEIPKNKHVLFRKEDGFKYFPQQEKIELYSEISQGGKNRLYYLTSDNKMYYYSQEKNSIIPLLRPIDM